MIKTPNILVDRVKLSCFIELLYVHLESETIHIMSSRQVMYLGRLRIKVMMIINLEIFNDFLELEIDGYVESVWIKGKLIRES